MCTPQKIQVSLTRYRDDLLVNDDFINVFWNYSCVSNINFRDVFKNYFFLHYFEWSPKILFRKF